MCGKKITIARFAEGFAVGGGFADFAEVTGAFHTTEGWDPVARRFGQSDPLQALHDVGGLL